MVWNAKGTDGANSPSRQHPGTISDQQMNDLGRRAEKRSGDDLDRWTETHMKAYDNRDQN